jgi:glycine cleavage system H lipoate-binding protein
MIPTAYEFHWDLGHIVFLGTFYGVLTVVVIALGVAAHRWLVDLRRAHAPAIDWEETFHDLPAARRHCRHEFRGTTPHRICDHGFECATCAQHRVFTAEEREYGGTRPDPSPTGFQLPARRYYHRGHTWVEPRADGTMDIGLDDLATRCLGGTDRVVVPAPDSELHPGDRVAALDRGSCRTRVLTPVSGRVIAAGDLTDGWLCRVRPTDPERQLDNLLHGREADVWMLREWEALQGWLSPDAAAPALADGGLPVDDLVQACPDADWDGILGQVCLET